MGVYPNRILLTEVFRRETWVLSGSGAPSDGQGFTRALPRAMPTLAHDKAVREDGHPVRVAGKRGTVGWPGFTRALPRAMPTLAHDETAREDGAPGLG